MDKDGGERMGREEKSKKGEGKKMKV